MPKTTPAKPPKGWKPFRLADGITRTLPEWADKPLGFVIPPDDALRQGAMVKLPKGRGKPARSKRLARV